MTTTNPATVDPTGATPPSAAPTTSVRALRVKALIGLGLLVLAFVATMMITLVDAVDPHDGVSGPLIDLALSCLALSGAAGLTAAAVPRTGMECSVRAKAVVAQYALMALGPLLALLD
ncbi:hypothetical protein [Streptomyces sp. NPDC002889]|uniref:hypothetical protein n=1 Tax=Streptomyces sp. NPDC002889 TaxID=3364669 RepID=UPI00367E6F0A